MRRAVVQQPSIRVYNADTIAVTNSYLHIALVDRAGHAEHADLRCSQTWVKQGQQWRLVDVHVSRLPVSS
jgi:ketosteroid isomerase-like protein